MVSAEEFKKCYQATPSHRNQERCPHYKKYRGRTGDDCSICGSIKVGSRWWYLKEAWYVWFVDGGKRPDVK